MNAEELRDVTGQASSVEISLFSEDNYDETSNFMIFNRAGFIFKVPSGCQDYSVVLAGNACILGSFIFSESGKMNNENLCPIFFFFCEIEK